MRLPSERGSGSRLSTAADLQQTQPSILNPRENGADVAEISGNKQQVDEHPRCSLVRATGTGCGGFLIQVARYNTSVYIPGVLVGKGEIGWMG